jgi:hypothetical protein
MNLSLLCGESSSPIHQNAYRGEATSISLNVLFSPPPAVQSHEGLSLIDDFALQMTILRLPPGCCTAHPWRSQVSSHYLPRPHRDEIKAHPFLAIHSADEHRMIYSFSNTTSFSIFYTFFSTFLILLWLMWLANSKWQPCFYPPQSHAQDDTQNWQKNWKPWWETCAVPENIQFSFSCSFLFTQLNCTV